jgi:hypothetical protein
LLSIYLILEKQKQLVKFLCLIMLLILVIRF